MKCKIPACKSAALWRPELSFVTSKTVNGGRESMPVPLAVCDGHRGQISAGDLVADEEWSELCDMYTSAERGVPDRASLALAWRPLGH